MSTRVLRARIRRGVAVVMAVAFAGAVASTLASCGASDAAAPSGAEVGGIALSSEALTLSVGNTAVLDVSARDAAGNAVPVSDVHWSSSNDAIASVSASGVVSGVSVGTATIAATAQGKSATARVSVSPRPIAAVRVSPSAVTLDVGKNASLVATPVDASGSAMGSMATTWRSANTAVAIVDANGKVTAVASGATTISATIDNQTATAAVAVSAPSPTSPPPTIGRIVVAPGVASLKWSGSIDRTVQLTVTAYSSAIGGSVVPGVTFTWTSNKNSVATVSTTGFVSAIADGIATISATANGVSGSAVITSTKR